MENKTEKILESAVDLKFEEFLRKICNEEYIGNITEEEGNKAVTWYKKYRLH